MNGIPEKIGKYRVLGVLGKGAMGLVYRAEDPLLGRQVAIKVITGDEVTDEMKERFHVEARAAAALDHPNIVVIYDLGEEHGTPYMAMEILKGEDLRHVLRRKPDMPVEEAADIVAQICEGLAYAHERKIIHRDIKPANIHVAPDGRCKIMDFGVAKMESTSLTKTGMVIGTPDYMSPEQIQGKAIDTRSDIFSVGVLFYEMLARNKPFAADSITSVIYNIVFKQPTSFADLKREVPAEIERIIRKAMAKDLTDRYQRIGDMAADLRRWLASRGRMAGAPPSQAQAGEEEATRVLSAEEMTAAHAAAHAGGTVQVGETPAQRGAAAEAGREGTVALGSAATARAIEAAPARPQRSKLPLVVGAVAAVAVIVVLAVVLSRRGAEPGPGPSGATGAVAAADVPMEFVVVPWARIEKLEDLDRGRVVPVSEPTTPALVALPAGRYRATLVTPDLSLKDSVEFTVGPSAPRRVVHVMAGFDQARAYAELVP